jgi:threonine/homoserine/homoserine lactone efflux protein
MDPRFAAFVGLAVLIIVTPGPDTALVIRNALRGGWPAASMTALGVGLGSLVWAAAAVLGLALLLQQSPRAFLLLKIAGAAYLAYLGIRSVIEGLRRRDRDDAQPAPGGRYPVTHGSFQQGLLNNLLNPKAGAFFITVLPQFAGPADPASRLALLMLVYEALVIGWLSAYGYLVSRAGRLLTAPGAQRWLHGITGLILIGLAVRLLLEGPATLRP